MKLTRRTVLFGFSTLSALTAGAQNDITFSFPSLPGITFGPIGSSAVVWKKEGAEIDHISSELLRIVPVVLKAWSLYAPGKKLVITSGHEASYDRSAKPSYHWHYGLRGYHALDFRMNNLRAAVRQEIWDYLNGSLPKSDEGVYFPLVHGEGPHVHLHLSLKDGRIRDYPWPPVEYRNTGPGIAAL